MTILQSFTTKNTVKGNIRKKGDHEDHPRELGANMAIGQAGRKYIAINLIRDKYNVCILFTSCIVNREPDPCALMQN